MIVKVCGMREADNIRAVEQLGVDWMGFIFWPPSSRYVAVRPAYLPVHAKRVGVFVDQEIEEVRQTARDYSLDIIQLHGHESPHYVSELQGEWLTMKAFNIATKNDLMQTVAYEGMVDYFLFDTKAQMVGGNGQKFDWNILSSYHGDTPFLLSGGIGPEDAERIKSFQHPRCVGIDLNSRFEEAPALKNVNKLKQFLYEQNQ